MKRKIFSHNLASPSKCPRGFSLAAVVAATAGLMILLLALTAIVQLDFQTSRSDSSVYQAELAVDFAFEEATNVLRTATANDHYAIAVVPHAVPFDDDGDGSISIFEDGQIDPNLQEEGRPYLYAIHGEVGNGSDSPSYRFLPLFASRQAPALQSHVDGGGLTHPAVPDVDEQGGELSDDDSSDSTATVVVGTPYLQPPVTSWRVLRNEEGEAIARYSYWVEDMQGRLDAGLSSGNQVAGRHARANEVWDSDVDNWNPLISEIAENYGNGGGEIPLWPAPGLNPRHIEVALPFPPEPLLGEVAAHTVDLETNGLVDESALDDAVRTQGEFAPTTNSLLALTGVSAPLERERFGADRGRLELVRSGALQGRHVEENFVTGNRGWFEQALVPFTPGLQGSVMGAPRRNLNLYLSQAAGAANNTGLASTFITDSIVGDFSNFVAAALPSFASERRGGFPEDYLQTIAANAIDYADVNSEPVVNEGAYRGVDAHPLVSEYASTFTWSWLDHIDDLPAPEPGLTNNFRFEANGNAYALLTIEIFAEVWNMSNHPIEGEVQMAFDSGLVFRVGSNPGLPLGGSILDKDTVAFDTEGFSFHSLEQEDDGRYYFPSRSVRLAPNAYRLIRFGSVRYALYVGDEDFFIPAPLPELTLDDAREYRLRWNGVLCDRTPQGLEEFSIADLGLRENDTSANVCGTWGEFGSFYTGMHDVRHSWWAGLNTSEAPAPVSRNAYPDNFSPGRRNVRFGTIGDREEEPFARALPSEWPDGGHDSTFDVDTFRDLTSTDSQRRPDNPDFLSMELPAEPTKSPVFLSGLGRFFSETELGNIFDPIMWRGDTNPGESIETWPYQEFNSGGESEVSVDAEPAQHVGGGNTLRIGRPEHGRFAQDPGTRASRLLDLFHCGRPFSINPTEQTGQVRWVNGHININTANREVIRALAAGVLQTDREIARETSFDTSRRFAPRTSDRYGEVSATDGFNSSNGATDEAGVIADAIIASRPFISRSQLADLRYPDDFEFENLQGELVFGNLLNHSLEDNLQRSDRAAEEVFARVYNSTTVRSRNFQVHVVGQALRQSPSGRVQVLSTRRKSFRVFVDADNRDASTGIFDVQDMDVEIFDEVNL